MSRLSIPDPYPVGSCPMSGQLYRNRRRFQFEGQISVPDSNSPERVRYLLIKL
uniref:PilZ domain-containing protein n=1 Tax=Heterorhabditis bacteriophora TaxID=37862 RepID=A0A1I7X185_HETBA